jgi:hypothetical protein
VTRIDVVDGANGLTPDMLRTRPENTTIFSRLGAATVTRSNVWPPPATERFVKIYGGPLDGQFHPASGWYSGDCKDGRLLYLEWMEDDG